ncbi:thyrotropin-releasing hormone receptor-like [Paramacrobiotus metropolitanus]|uniref:thyrotropin-releasing hormone receptor-like n=1 Tax=Paramacrobiotus metropolitanus TaxID=2943436 RepID=UPI002445C0EF|nr:thyrotropin-releasing hormone receptor-like [Paramacrobiotus metropolitanus]XP_055340651.1 thyrotropin-releasing hormone receptor-like [Paramacrobiotus metropolitanus]
MAANNFEADFGAEMSMTDGYNQSAFDPGIYMGNTTPLVPGSAGTSTLSRATMFPLTYRLIGTIIHSLIFIVGFLGNVMIVIVVKSTKTLRTPTYCYLVSLAVADILLVCSTIPEAILSYQLYSKQWVLGHFGCSLMAFTSFLAINAGSISILAFTVERYIAICHPMLAQKVCTVSRARRIIVILWLIVCLYCAPWLGLAVTKPLLLSDVQGLETCDYRLPRNLYRYFFVLDATVFYFIPLTISVILYSRMGYVLYKSIKQSTIRKGIQMSAENSFSFERSELRSSPYLDQRRPTEYDLKRAANSAGNKRSEMSSTDNSRIQGVRMLVIVVIVFAVLWLPYRGLLVYNSFGKKPFMDKYFVLFAKTLVYCNSAVNPFLYTVLSRKFRMAFFRILQRWFRKKPSRNRPYEQCVSSSNSNGKSVIKSEETMTLHPSYAAV